jgi:hypothetical protein
MKTQFYNSNGFLTSYAFSCGYIQKEDVNENNRKTMYKEHCVFHVKGFNQGVHFWETFSTLTEAKKYYLSIKF